MLTAQKLSILNIILGGFFLATSFLSFAQTDKSSFLVLEAYESYFKDDRKTVHLHLNKNTFITGEHIWFSTYIFNHTQNLPSENDEYVYLDLIDESGQIIQSKTILYKNGLGKGDLLLDRSLETGNYFLQTYTSNMLNFEENESTIYPIQIRNLESGQTSIPLYHSYSDSLDVSISAEGGNLVEDLFSSVAVKVTNIFGYAIQPDSVQLIEENNLKINTISIDKNGLGTFSFLPRKNKRYSLITYLNNKKIKKVLPFHEPFGYTIAIDRNHKKKQFIITINSKPLNKQQLTLIIHKDGNAIKLPIVQNNLKKQGILLSYDVVRPGVNTISLLDESGKIVAERLVFHRPVLDTNKVELKNATTYKDSIKLAFQQTKSSSNSIFSASIVPKNVLNDNYTKKAFYSIHLEQYLRFEDWKNLNGLTCSTIEELYYLDQILLLGKSKYKWKNILNKELVVPNQQKLTATLEGYVNTFKDQSESLKVLLYSKENELLLSTSVDSEKKFAFENIFLAKGSKINLTLSSKNGKPIYANFFYTIKPNIKNFRHRYRPKQLNLQNLDITSEEVVASFKQIEQLDEVTVTANELKYQKFFKSFYGVKIDSTDGSKTLKYFLSQQGYNSMQISPFFGDPRRAGSIQTGKLTNRCGYVFPSIMIDGKFDAYIGAYENIRMEFIDEIYFDRATSCSALVVVFTNEKYKNRPLVESEKKSKEFIVDTGYDIPTDFERPDYFNTTDATFNKFGILSWTPSTTYDHTTPITFVAPLNSQNSIKVTLEGMTAKGELISQDILVDLDE